MCSTLPTNGGNGKKRASPTPPSCNHDRENNDEGLNKTNEDDTQSSNGDGPKNPANMLASAPWWSKMIFYWPSPLLKLGMERPLVETDIPEILPVDSSRYNRKYLSELWKRERERCNVDDENESKRGKPSLHRAILVDFFRSIWYIQPVMCLTAVAKIIQAVNLGNLIESFEGGTENGYAYAAVIVACGIIILFEHRK